MPKLKVVIMTAALAVAGWPAHADDFKRLSGDEIRSQIVGHKFRGTYWFDGDRPSEEAQTYFTADGKFLIEISVSGKPRLISTGTFELKEDKVCVHDLGLMRDPDKDRCFEAYRDASKEFWSGYVEDAQDKIGIPLDYQIDISPAEMEARWVSWENVRQAAGPVDAFGDLSEISLNPFRFKGKILIVRGSFRQMIGEHRGWFRSQDSSYDDFVIDGIPNDMFKKDGQDAMFVGEVSGNLQVTVEGSDHFLPIIAAKSALPCKAGDCKEYFANWK